MKTAHGSPHSRPCRHPSNSSNHSVRNFSGSDTCNLTKTMPPILRLDSTGEGGSYSRPVKEGVCHQRTNTCRQGASLGGGSDFGLFRKLINFMPQQSPSLNLLDPTRARNGICALDDLVNSKQPQNTVAMARKSAHVKNARTILPHRNRYGQWGTVGSNYTILPPGVFPCHVFQAAQSHRELSGAFWSNSGHSVLKDRMAVVEGSTLLETLCKYSADCWSSPQPPKVDAASSSSTDQGSDKFYAAGSRICSVKTYAEAHDRISSTVQKSSNSQLCDTTNERKCTSEFEQQKEQTAEKTHQQVKDIPCEMGVSESETGCKDVLQFDSGWRQDCKMDQVSNKTTTTPGQHSAFQCDSLSLEITRPAVSEFRYVDSSTVKGNVSSECAQISAYQESFEIDGDTNDDKEDTENDDIWNCFMSRQFTLSNLCTKPKTELKRPDGTDERCSPKPCPAVTEKWYKMYSSASCVVRQNCKVRFECGEGKDSIHIYEMVEDETLTVMEIQKAKELNRQHKGKAAELLQNSCDVEDDTSHGDDGHVDPEEEKIANDDYDLEMDLGDLSKDSDSEDESEEENECDESKEEEEEKDDTDDDDDDIIFEESC